jgi:hypothetical protein
LLQKIHDHLGLEYVYADEPTAAAPEQVVDLTPESLASLPKDLIHLMREAVIGADLDQLLARIQEVETLAPEMARELLCLAEDFEYEKLLGLFGSGNHRPNVPGDASPAFSRVSD